VTDTNGAGEHGEGGKDPRTTAALWATPTSRDHKDGANPSENVATNSLLGRQAPRSGIAGPPSSPDGRSLPRLWQTPSDPTFTKRRQVGQTERTELLLPAEAPAMMAMWQTPRTGAHGTPGEGKGHGGQPKGMRLNPLFVEWLMGLPLGWTGYAPVVMPSSQPSLPSRGEHS
jgi:hypothetical protein